MVFGWGFICLETGGGKFQKSGIRLGVHLSGNMREKLSEEWSLVAGSLTWK